MFRITREASRIEHFTNDGQLHAQTSLRNCYRNERKRWVDKQTEKYKETNGEIKRSADLE